MWLYFYIVSWNLLNYLRSTLHLFTLSKLLAVDGFFAVGVAWIFRIVVVGEFFAVNFVHIPWIINCLPAIFSAECTFVMVWWAGLLTR